MYSIGDKVVYPMHGAGIIKALEDREILGEMKQYFVMQMPIDSAEVLIPVESLEKIGVRDVVVDSIAEDVLRDFSEHEIEFNSNWNKRYRENMEKIKGGNIYDVAHVVKALMVRERDRGLSSGERKMLVSAKKILISELMLAMQADEKDIEIRIDEIISAC